MTTYKVWNGTSWVYIDSQNYDSRYILNASKGNNSGVASLDESGHIPSEQLPSSITGAVSYKGVFDPASGAPIPAAQGYYYVASGVGTVSATSFATGDWLVYVDETTWNKIENSSSSVTWSNVSNKPASYAPDTHGNESHDVVYITVDGVTYEALSANGDVGTGATQVSSGNHTHTGAYQPVDADLTAIAGLVGTSGLLKKTAANTWTLDTNSYLTEASTVGNALMWDSNEFPSDGVALQVLRLNDDGSALEFATVASGVGTFLDLTDTPSAYTGQSGKYVKVNNDGDALEFATVEGGTAATITVDTTNFNKNLSAADDTVQKALDKLDELISGTGSFLGWFDTELSLNTAHPIAEDGNYAFVYDTDTMWVWESNAWADSYRKSFELEPLNPIRNCLTAWNDDNGTYLRCADQNAYVPNGLFVKVPHSTGTNKYKVKTYGDLSTESYAGIIDLTGYVDAYYQNYPGVGFVCNMIESVNTSRFGAGLLISGHNYSYGYYNTTTLSPYIALAIKPSGGSAILEPLKIGSNGVVVCNPGISATSMNITSGTYNVNGSPHTHDVAYLKLSGGTLTGALDLDTHRISNVADPVNGKDAVNLDTVSGIIVGMKWQDPIESIENTPPVTPTENYRYLVGTSPTGAFVDHENDVATWSGTEWTFETPDQGWCVSNKDDNYSYNFNGTFWAQLPGATSHSALQNLGTDDHSQYVHISNARTISARHTFSNAVPFTVSNSGLVSNLNANYLDGATKADFAAVLHSHGLVDLDDIQIVDLTDGQILSYDASSGKFINIENAGSFAINPDHQFATTTDRDLYFETTHPEELVNGIFIAVGEGFQQYNGVIDPYDADNWEDRTAITRGPAGTNGTNGIDGADGATGPQGAQGPQGPQGIQGPAGSPGTSITMKGSVATSGDLPSSGNTVNDGYYCEADGDCYVWDGDSWNNVGPIVGPPGPQGIQGTQGIQGIQGPIGNQGVQGETGPIGATGPIGPRGPSGFDNPYYQEAVEGIMDTPPEVYDYNDRFIVSDTPSGVWIGHANNIATWMDTDQWYFEIPDVGWALYDLQDTVHRVWSGLTWVRWESTGGVWGSITGTLSNQTDLNESIAFASASVDIHGATSTNEFSVGDEVIIYDTSEGGNRKILRGNFFSNLDGEYINIHGTVEETTPASAMELLVYDPSVPANRRITRENFFSGFTPSSTFTALTDTPTSYSGAASQYVRVNAAGDALEFATVASSYTLPTATDTVLGGVKIGSGITITDGVISVASGDAFPDQSGNAGKYLSTDGTDASWVELPSTTFTSGDAVVTLPENPSVGQVYQYVGTGVAWTINANTGQTIRSLGDTGNQLTSGHNYASVALICIGTDVWSIYSSYGTVNLVTV